tara:strand:+ start:723 stop:950 length:228 start_codon:yes stop_codon:yes gene_type:complete
MKSYKLSDEVIAQIAKLVQLAIITGTDVVDNLRTLRVVETETDDHVLVLTPEYREIGENQLQNLLEKAQNMNEEV